MKAEDFFENLWQDYIQMAPRAARLHILFQERGEKVINDHVAFRTLDLEPIQLEALELHLLKLSYKRLAPYTFPEKKLHAWGYVPSDPLLPKIFLSALNCSALSFKAQKILQGVCAQIDPARVKQIDVFWAGRLWKPVCWEEYQTLLKESEYAAWVAALGLRPNHFTIAVNNLVQTPSVESVLEVVESEGIPINDAGGRVKGSPEVLLEQGSTLADRIPVEFAEGERHEIPTSYYEFARRYPDRHGRLYEGFVATSADRIFESTDVKAPIDK